MEMKNNILNRYRSRIIFPAIGMVRRGAAKHTVRVEDYILPAKWRKEERMSERFRETLYERG